MNAAANTHPKGRTCAIVGLWLQLGPVVGLLGTVFGMQQAFGVLSQGDGIASPDQLASSIGLAMWTSAVGLVLGLAGVAFLLVALFKFRFRAPWFLWWLVAISCLQLVAWPIGTLIGVGLLIYLWLHRSEFLTYDTEPNQAVQ